METGEIYKKFNSFINDAARWRWLMLNQDKSIIVMCDNDSTYITIDCIDDDGYAEFDDHIGCTDGVLNLLDVMGIHASFV